MKKLIVPTLLVLFAAGATQAKAGFSIGISIGNDHRHAPPPVIVHRPPPVVISRPPVVVVPRRDDCDRPPVYVKECDRPVVRYDRHDRYDRYDRYNKHYRDDRGSHVRWNR